MIDATPSLRITRTADPSVHGVRLRLPSDAGIATDLDVSQQLHLCALAAYASTLDHVQVLLGSPDAPAASLSIRCLSPELRPAPLHALGLRLLALNQSEQQAAIDAFVRAAEEVPAEHRTAALQQLVDAARSGVPGLEQRERRAMGDAEAAVQRGDNVCNTCERYGVTLPELRLALETLSVRCHGWQAAADGASVAKIAALYGITLPGPLAMLASIRCSARSQRASTLRAETPKPS